MKSSLSKFLVLASFVLFSCKNEETRMYLPVYGSKTLKGNDTVYHKVGKFSFVNQYGETISDQTVKNKMYIANFFFATCQSICPEMSTNLTGVQEQFADDDSLLILSHSVNPLHDTVEVLMNYAGQYGAKRGKWHLLTGDKKAIYDMARDSYLVNALEDDGTPEGFLHSELFLLIDTEGRIRGMFDGTDKAEVNKLVEAIKLLKKEA